MSDDDGDGSLRRRGFLALCSATAIAGCTAPSGDGGSPTPDQGGSGTTPPGSSSSRTTATTRTTAEATTATTDGADSGTTQGTTESGETTTQESPSLSIPRDLSWSMHGGDATNAGALDTVGPDGLPERVWDVPVEGIYTLPGPACVDGVCYVGTGKKVYAVDAATGDRRWTTGVDYLAHHYSAAAADGRVFVAARSLDGVRSGGGRGALYAIDAASGTVEWRVDGPMSSPPTVVDGTVYATSSGDAGVVHAFDAASGSERWSFEFAPEGARGSAYGAPAVVDGTVYATVSAHDGDGATGYLYALDGGNVRWRYGVDAESRVPPVISEGVVYAATAGGRVHAVSLGGEGRWTAAVPGAVFSTPAVDGDQLFALAEGELVAVSLTDRELQWQAETGDQSINGLAVTREGVYIGGSSVISLDRGDGSRRWAYPIPGNSGGYGAPIVLDGAVLVGACIKWEPRDPYDDHVFALA